MDFAFTTEQEAVRELAGQILGDKSTPERLKELEEAGEPHDADLWAALADAGLLALSLREDVGGAGLGFVETCLVLEQVGRTTALVPVLSTVVLAALAVDQFGSETQRRELLGGVGSGDTLLTAALVEAGTEPDAPTTTAHPDGEGWRLDGVKICVPAGQQVAHILVPARTDEESVGVFVVDPTAAGVSQVALDTTSGQPESRLTLEGVEVGSEALIGSPEQGAEIVAWVVQRATAALCSTAIGVCDRAVELTAEYVKTREQFDRPIATFQAVGQRVADAYIDAEAVRLTAWQAAWRLAEGLPAAEQVAIAKFWASEGGQRVVHAAQHLHGGVGVDRDYPLHRYFLWAKHIELTLGGTTPSLLRLGRILAAEPV